MKKTLLLFVFIIGVATASIVLAAPPGSPYSPGETLDPACAPGATNCTVVGAFTEADASLQTTDDTPTLLYSLPVAEDTAVDFEVEAVVASSAVNDRYLFNFEGLFYRQTGGNITQQDGTINMGGPISSSGTPTPVTFGGATTEYNVTDDGGNARFTWNGVGTGPAFVSSGLMSGDTVTISGPSLPGSHNGSFIVFTLTENSILLQSPSFGYSANDVSGIAISTTIASPTASISLSANTGTQSIDVMATGLAATTLNWRAGMTIKTVTAP